jgi:DNA polymerase-3 subunit alpha
MAALLSTEKGSTEKLVQYIAECREMGIKVLPPDVNTSGLDFTVEGRDIRFGLSAIKNVGEGAIRSVLGARQEHGRFQALHDLCSAVDLRLVNKRVLEALVQSGALDSLGGRRSQLAAAIDSALDLGQKQRVDREAGQSSLFGASDAAVAAPKLPDLPDWDEQTRLAHEKATLGFYVTGHPLARYEPVLAGFATHRVSQLRETDSGGNVAVAGIVGNLKRRKSKKGEWWASMTLEDLSGLVDVLVFPKAYESCQALLVDDGATLVNGRLEVDEDQVRIFAEAVCPLDELRERRAEAVQLSLDAADLDDELIHGLQAAIEANRGDAHLFFEVAAPGRYRLLARAQSSYRVTPSLRFSREVEALLGPNRVRYRPRAEP